VFARTNRTGRRPARASLQPFGRAPTESQRGRRGYALPSAAALPGRAGGREAWDPRRLVVPARGD
jgi:hypothetical protein